MENVTDRVQSAVVKDMDDAEALKARNVEIAKIEKESMEETGLRSDVVKFYQGGEYWLYRYKKYTDVRLVMAPEQMIAFYGGDYDNFTYPRWDLDMAFFRVYENERPLKTENYLKWNSKGAGKDELVFISGHPGSTDRLFTNSQLIYQRDYVYPELLKYLKIMIKTLEEFSKKGKEQERRAKTQIFYVENGIKAISGMLKGLQDNALLDEHKKKEVMLIKSVESNPNCQIVH